MKSYFCAVFLVANGVLGLMENNHSGDVCYGSLGCFPNGAPWSTFLRPVPPPQSPEVVGTRFYLYTRNYRSRFHVKHPSDGVFDVEGSDYDGSKQTVFIIHGFFADGNETEYSDLKDAILGKIDANVIIVDYGASSYVLNYKQVASNNRVVAALITQLLDYLIIAKGSDVSRVHLIGHSLGADISGYVGKAIANIARITALDAAQLLMEGYEAEVRLDQTDALFVDVIHTSGRSLIPLKGHGIVNAVGHVDFFVNGGWNQTGCQTSFIFPKVTTLDKFPKAFVKAIMESFGCAHKRSIFLLIAAYNNRDCTFWGHKSDAMQRTLSLFSGGKIKWWPTACNANSCSAMGHDAINYPARGSFEVTTSGSVPFCLADPKADAIMKPFYIN